MARPSCFRVQWARSEASQSRWIRRCSPPAAATRSTRHPTEAIRQPLLIGMQSSTARNLSGHLIDTPKARRAGIVPRRSTLIHNSMGRELPRQSGIAAGSIDAPSSVPENGSQAGCGTRHVAERVPVALSSASRQPQRRTLMGVKVVLAEGESAELALRRLRKLVEKHGITHELRVRRWFIKPTRLRRRKRFQKWYWSRDATLAAKQRGEQ